MRGVTAHAATPCRAVAGGRRPLLDTREENAFRGDDPKPAAAAVVVDVAEASTARNDGPVTNAVDCR